MTAQRARLTYETRPDADGNIRVIDAGRYENERIAKEGRWKPLQEGTLILARVSVRRNPDGSVAVRDGRGGYRRIDAKFTLMKPDGTDSRRWGISQMIVFAGDSPKLEQEVRNGKGILMRILTCYHPFAKAKELMSQDPGSIDGLVVPVVLGHGEDFKTKARIQTADPLCPDPRSGKYELYCEMMSRRPPYRVASRELKGLEVVEEKVDFMPGWRMHPGSKAYDIGQKLIEKHDAAKDKVAPAVLEMKVQTKRGPRGKTKPDLFTPGNVQNLPKFEVAAAIVAATPPPQYGPTSREQAIEDRRRRDESNRIKLQKEPAREPFQRMSGWEMANARMRREIRDAKAADLRVRQQAIQIKPGDVEEFQRRQHDNTLAIRSGNQLPVYERTVNPPRDPVNESALTAHLNHDDPDWCPF